MKISIFVILSLALHLAVSNPIPSYKPLSPQQAALLAAWTPESKQSMWELSGQYQGDIVFAPGQRNGVTDTRLRWPNREIPYEISGDFSSSERAFIESTLATEYAKTCVRPRPRTSSDTDYVYVTGENSGCWSYVGRISGRQQLNLQRNGCIWYGTITHEFLHAAGFFHQQSATERDDWVDILWQNISPGTENNFEKYGANTITSYGEQYDYNSVMHYGMYAFSSNGQPTIVPKDSSANIGQRDGLSTIDIAKLNKMYGCA